MLKFLISKDENKNECNRKRNNMYDTNPVVSVIIYSICSLFFSPYSLHNIIILALKANFFVW